MRRATIKEYDALAERLTNLVGIMDHRFKNLCIKAEPVALLPVQVLVEGELQNLEQCAVIGKENDYQFMIFPKYDDDLVAIVKGIVECHPEFKVEGKTTTIDSMDGDGKDKTVDVRYLLVTMPEVNDDRYDILKDSVDAVWQECKAQMEKTNTIFKAKFAELAAGETKEDLDILDQELDKLRNQWNDQRDKVHQAKLDEIEEAHQKWLARQEEDNLQRAENEDARGEGAVHSMKMNPENED